MYLNKFKRMMNVISDEKTKYYVYGNSYGNYIIGFILILLAFDFISLLKSFNFTIYILVLIIYYFIIVVFLINRVVGVALTENRLILAKCNVTATKVKKIYEVKISKIKSITVHKFLCYRFCKYSFIDETGCLRTLKFFYSNYVMGGINVKGEDLYRELVEIERVIDKGDF